MKTKKSQTGIIIFIVCLVIVIGMIISLIMGYKRGWFSKEIKQEEKKVITIKARLWEESTQQYVSGYYSLRDYYASYSVIREGQLDSKWNELSNIPQNKTFAFFYWNDDYYPNADFFAKSWSFKNFTISGKGMGTLEKDFKKGKISVKSEGILEKEKINNITLNVTAVNGSVKRLSFCIYHTLGIISIKNPSMTIECNGYWHNWTYDLEGNKINLTDISENLYWCANLNRVEYCSKTYENICYVPTMNTPRRLIDKVDLCFYTGKTLKENNSYLLPLEIKTMKYFSETDYLEVYVLDQELQIYNNEYAYEDTEGNDVGIEDYVSKIK